MKRTTYLATVSHAHYAPLNGELEFAVTTNNDGTRYVKNGKMGCSRDYKTSSDETAIRYLCSEHACRPSN